MDKRCGEGIAEIDSAVFKHIGSYHHNYAYTEMYFQKHGFDPLELALNSH